MSPEQAAGDPLDGRSDLFSLGIVLYECATGRRPFVGNSARAVLSAILHTAPTAPGLFNEDLPQRLQQVISDCLEKDPDLRYQNAASLRADLKRVKRDLESGRTASVTRPLIRGRPPTSSRSGTVDKPSPLPPFLLRTRQLRLSQPASGPTLGSATSGAAGACRSCCGRRRGGCGWIFSAAPVSDAPTTTAAVSSSAAFVQSRLESAERSLQAKQYRDAQRYADEVLAAAPGHAQAAADSRAGRAQLRQAEAGIERARKMIQAGDVRGAVRALDEARTIDPFAPGLIEVSQLMADRFKSQAEAAEAGAATIARRGAGRNEPPHRPRHHTGAVEERGHATSTGGTIARIAGTNRASATSRAAAHSGARRAEPPARTEPTESAAVKPGPSAGGSTADRKPACRGR